MDGALYDCPQYNLQIECRADRTAYFAEGAPLPGNSAAVVCSLDDPVALILGQRREKGQDASVDRLGEIQVVAVEDLHESAALVDALNDADSRFDVLLSRGGR